MSLVPVKFWHDLYVRQVLNLRQCKVTGVTLAELQFASRF